MAVRPSFIATAVSSYSFKLATRCAKRWPSATDTAAAARLQSQSIFQLRTHFRRSVEYPLNAPAALVRRENDGRGGDRLRELPRPGTIQPNTSANQPGI